MTLDEKGLEAAREALREVGLHREGESLLTLGTVIATDLARAAIEAYLLTSLHHPMGERITRKDLNNAHRMGREEGRLAAEVLRDRAK